MTLDVQVATVRGRLALDVTLTVGRETVAVVGPNGAGKTTLLRLVAGLSRPLRGRIELAGRVLDDTDAGVHVPPQDRGIGVVFQDYRLFPHRSSLDNVAFGVRARGAGRRTARAVGAEALARVGLADFADARPGQLSGGQRQRVALARALAVDPALLLLDEPLAALDVQARQDLRRDLRGTLGRLDVPVVLVTHDPLEAATLADRIAVLEAGEVTQVGTVEEITRRPRSVWAARLAGVNLYRGIGQGHEVRLDGGGALTVADRVEGAVYVAVPPVAVALYRSRPEGTPRNVWPGVVDGLEPLGDRLRVHVAGTPAITAEVTPAAAAALDLARGGEVVVSVKATEVTAYQQ